MNEELIESEGRKSIVVRFAHNENALSNSAQT